MTFTFDGHLKGQEEAAQILSDHGMAGTFFVNSGYLDFPAYLDLDELRAIARNRSEIGGASLYGNDLSRLTVDQAKQQVCDDRVTLAQLGFQVTSFAYPHGAGTAQVKAWRSSAATTAPGTSPGCTRRRATARAAPRVRPCRRPTTSGSGPTSPAWRSTSCKRTSQREDAGGGWVPLVFTYVGVDPHQETRSPRTTSRPSSPG